MARKVEIATFYSVLLQLISAWTALHCWEILWKNEQHPYNLHPLLFEDPEKSKKNATYKSPMAKTLQDAVSKKIWVDHVLCRNKMAPDNEKQTMCMCGDCDGVYTATNQNGSAHQCHPNSSFLSAKVVPCRLLEFYPRNNKYERDTCPIPHKVFPSCQVARGPRRLHRLKM